jgi:DNA-binding GntR family transcriptional regulator
VDAFEPGVATTRELWQLIVDPLRRSIILGELPPGLHLEEAALAHKFGVSRIPVREALARLAHEGLVRVEPRRGAFVVGVTEEGIGHVYEYRGLLERYAIRRAADLVDAPGLAALLALVDRMDDAAGRDERRLVAQIDAEFHRLVIALTGNPRLSAAWESMAGMVAAILGITDRLHPDLRQAVGGHRAMVDALARRDADLAELLVREHLREAEQVMRAVVRGNGTAGRPSPAEATG